MSDSSWCDITVENADELVSFYEAVMGWKKEPIDMDGYNDYVTKWGLHGISPIKYRVLLLR